MTKKKNTKQKCAERGGVYQHHTIRHGPRCKIQDKWIVAEVDREYRNKTNLAGPFSSKKDALKNIKEHYSDIPHIRAIKEKEFDQLRL